MARPLALFERVGQFDPRALEIADVAGDEGEVVDDSDGCDLLVERAACVGNSQITPDLRRVRIEGEDAFTIRFDDARQPGLKKPRLLSVAAAPDEFDAAAQLAYRYRREKHRLARIGHSLEEGEDAPIRPGALSRLADHVGVNQIHARSARRTRPARNPHRGRPRALTPGPRRSCAGEDAPAPP